MLQTCWGLRCPRPRGTSARGPGLGPRSGGARQLRTCAGGLQRGSLPTPHPADAPSPSTGSVCLRPAQQPRAALPLWSEHRGLSVGATRLSGGRELGAGWTGPQLPSFGPSFSLLPVTSRPLRGWWCGESCTFWPTFMSVEKAGGASGQGAVLSGFLETKIGGVRLPDRAALL